MYCNTPLHPVISKKTGHLFEKSLILKYIEEHGKCPITGQDLTPNDLIDVIYKKGTESSVKPSQAIASIPSMLQTFQNEWDSVMLETFTLRQQLDKSRKELSHSLYQHDAACRVIARLMKDNDDTKSILRKNQNNMEDETSNTLSETVSERLTNTAEILSSNRKQRTISPSLKSPEEMSNSNTRLLNSEYRLHQGKGIQSIDVLNSLILTGGRDGSISVFDKQYNTCIGELNSNSGPVNCAIFHNTPEFAFSSHNRDVKIWSLKDSTCLHTMEKLHLERVTGLALHQSGHYFLTSSLDQTWSFCEIETGTSLLKSSNDESGYTCIQFHPDGLLFGTGLQNNAVKIWDVKSQQVAATLQGHSGEVTSLSFSENGYYLASSSKDKTVRIWDLRKVVPLHTLQFNSPVSNASFDYSGIYLGATCTDGTVGVYQAKVWTELINTTVPNTCSPSSIRFGPNATEKLVSDETEDPSSYKQDLLELDSRFYINSFRLRAAGELAKFAAKFGLSETWSDSTQLDELLCSIGTFRQDSTIILTQENSDEVEEYVEFPNLIELGEAYQSVAEYTFTFIHPLLIAELSAHFEHQNSIPIELLEKVFENEYEEYVRPKKLRKPNSNEESIDGIREWLSHNDEYVFFTNILLYYNTPERVFSLLEKPKIGKEKVKNILQPLLMKFEDIADEYWILIMEFIEDPFSLTRFGMAHSKFYNILCKNRKEWYAEFKRNIGLFSYLS
ncbi:PRP19/PSO4 pre-mRNA processing factor [Naegleria gruberi]|uniref:Pre-mRNA-processing factor 19 n=1 Tax=Naegleria gruberi TaxID=5762 RepID=D2VJM3_NAEGR|nr:PRP19/PSO4 pre-mRNA processing factor [Naegleria gruberi]EFC42976.1 PRP19/PSO4 pre-mRNA processing factor [Naegleria gruberi]|eukprot:XP_002675720.1 PRP19/PSO4 pre-mRNA processing factor [Naegleria gruberi strain NEG-M]